MQPQIFEIAVDVLKKEVIKNTHNKINSNVSMAMAKLITLSEECGSKLPKIEESVWY